MDKFKPGDIVVCVRSEVYPELIKEEFEVTSRKLPHYGQHDLGYNVKLLKDGRDFWGPESYFQFKRGNLYDGEQRVTWKDCEWQPKKEEVMRG